MDPNARVAKRNVARDSWRTSRRQHSLLLQMAKEAEDLAAQAERLRDLKKQARGVTFGKIATHVGVTERQVQRWFAGHSDIDASRLKKLARYFGTTEDYIEYGVVKRERGGTPDPFAKVNGTIEQRLTAIEELLQLIRAEMTASVAEVMSRIDEALPPIQEAPRRRRA